MTERLDSRDRRRRPLPRSSTASARGGMADVYLRPGPAARAQGRAEDALPPLRRGPRVRRALPPRGVERRRPAAPARRRRLRPRRVRRHLLHRDGVPRGALAEARSSSRRRRSTPTARSTYAIQILRAARFAHRRGIIHRDLKPHNVIVDDEGRAKVTDFGIARAGASDMTQTGSIMGTAQYLSPEQAQGHAVSAAVGPLLDRDHALRDAHRPRAVRRRERGRRSRSSRSARRPSPPSAYNPAVTPELEEVVLRALEKDPARRYPDADAFIAALAGRARRHGHRPSLAPVAARRRLRPPERGLRLPARSRWPPREDDATARRWWLWSCWRCSSPAWASPRVLLLRHAAGHRARRRRRRPGQRRRPRCASDGFSRRHRREDGRAARGPGHRPGPDRRRRRPTKGSTVTLTVSDGPAAGGGAGGRRPDRRRRRAGDWRSAGFKASEREENSDTVRQGQGDRASARPRASRSTRARRSRSSSPAASRRSQVPDVVGKSFDEAPRRRCRRPASRSRATEQGDRDKDPGTVLARTPTAATQADKGSTVALIVAKAPSQVAVPDVDRRGRRPTAIAALSGRAS